MLRQLAAESLHSGKESKLSQYRLSDNHLRFYLKYIFPNKGKIEKGQYKPASVSSLVNWEAIMGLQFENLVLNNHQKILDCLNIRPEDIVCR